MNESVSKCERWFVIVNPVAGRGRGLRDWPAISSLLVQNGIEYDARFTERKYHATELAVEAVMTGYRRLVVVGGDGTINETVSGIFLQQQVPGSQVLMAVVAVGMENDWIRMFGIPRNYGEAVRAIAQEYSFLQDVGRVSFYESRVRQVRYLTNVGSFGFSGVICRCYSKMRERGYHGRMLYFWSILRTVFRYHSSRMVIWVDDERVFSGKVFTASVGIGRYTYGGISQTPYAVADDGLFDLTLIPSMSRLRLFGRFGVLYTNNIYNITGVTLHRGARIRARVLSGGEPVQLELDGEPVGYSDFTFEILERAIRVVVSEKFLGQDS